MASGAMVHPCEFFLFCILQRMWLGNNTVPKEQDPVFNWTVLDEANGVQHSNQPSGDFVDAQQLPSAWLRHSDVVSI
jgi:hypothetical protein